MKNELGALMLWIDRKLNKNHDALVTKIDAIQNLFETSSEASASAADILEGKTAFNGTTLMTGTMVNQESREATLLAGGTYNIPRGFHDGAGRVLATDLASQTAGTATAGGILQGLKAWVAGRMIDGTMKDRRGVTVTAGAVTQDDEYTYLSIPEEACYNANSKVRTPNSNLKLKFAKEYIGLNRSYTFKSKPNFVLITHMSLNVDADNASMWSEIGYGTTAAKAALIYVKGLGFIRADGYFFTSALWSGNTMTWTVNVNSSTNPSNCYIYYT